MNNWIDFGALWRIAVIGMLCGAGLPAVFAVGLKALSLSEHDEPAPSGGGGFAAATRNPVGLAAAGLCFAVVLAAIGWGIYLIVSAT